MTRDAEMKAILQAVHAAVVADDWDAAEQHLDDSLVIIEADNLPYRGLYEGRDALRRLFTKVMAYWRDPELVVHATPAGDEHVVVLATFHVTSRATGRRAAMPLAEVYRFKGAKIDLIQPFYFDTAALVALENTAAQT